MASAKDFGQRTAWPPQPASGQAAHGQGAHSQSAHGQAAHGQNAGGQPQQPGYPKFEPPFSAHGAFPQTAPPAGRASPARAPAQGHQGFSAQGQPPQQGYPQGYGQGLSHGGQAQAPYGGGQSQHSQFSQPESATAESRPNWQANWDSPVAHGQGAHGPAQGAQAQGAAAASRHASSVADALRGSFDTAGRPATTGASRTEARHDPRQDFRQDPRQDYRHDLSGGHDPYATQYPNYAAPAAESSGYQANPSHGVAAAAQPTFAQPFAQPGAGLGGYDGHSAHAYAQPHSAHASHDGHIEPSLGTNWPGEARDGYAEDGQGYDAAQSYDDGSYAQNQAGYEEGGEFGFAEPAGGELDPNYAEDEYDYVDEPAPRRGSIAKIAAALVGAVVIGGGLAYGYRTVVGDSGTGEPPTVMSAAAPSKVKPVDAGGKKFEHSDSKMMSRLGESSSGAAVSSDTDGNGTRKVSTLVVGRDGSIQGQTAPVSEPVTIPGLTVVDAFGNAGNAGPQAPSSLPPQARPVAPVAAATPTATPAMPKMVNAEQPERVVVEPPKTTASLNEAAAPARPARVAAADPEPVARAPAPQASRASSGYVAVLASLPRSNSSRMAALARFADMQQKYSGALAGKTPDVAAADLGAKGKYHRLVVGPPASRQQASSLCSELKREGFNDCWVTAY